jgi:copper chaperone CopZ
MKIFIIFLVLGLTVSAMAGQTSASKIRTAVINTYGMHCTGCEETVEAEIMKLDGIKSVKADHINKKVTVKYESSKVTLSQVKEAIKAAGYKLEK